MTVKNNAQLIETMTLLILVNTQCLQYGVLSIDLMIDQVKEPFLKKGLLMVMIPNMSKKPYLQRLIPSMFIGI